jgi:hypothetical protein
MKEMQKIQAGTGIIVCGKSKMELGGQNIGFSGRNGEDEYSELPVQERTVKSKKYCSRKEKTKGDPRRGQWGGGQDRKHLRKRGTKRRKRRNPGRNTRTECNKNFS